MYQNRKRDSFRSATHRASTQGWREIHRQGLMRNWDSKRVSRRIGKILDSDVLVEWVRNVYDNNDRIVAIAENSDTPYESVIDRLARLGLPDGVAWHGREYAYNYIHLVDRLLGREAGKIMRKAFKDEGLKYSKKRELTEDQRAAVAERLASAKADKIIAELSERIQKGEL